MLINYTFLNSVPNTFFLFYQVGLIIGVQMALMNVPQKDKVQAIQDYSMAKTL